MPKSSPFVGAVLDRFNSFAPVTARAMFGGHGQLCRKKGLS
ncbi:hypothetical protein [Acaryochloris sp. IP29b_bin.137]|nr:hypothetical protein [Acaryochloris sp. IP29b_bin.137]